MSTIFIWFLDRFIKKLSGPCQSSIPPIHSLSLKLLSCTRSFEILNSINDETTCNDTPLSLFHFSHCNIECSYSTIPWAIDSVLERCLALIVYTGEISSLFKKTIYCFKIVTRISVKNGNSRKNLIQTILVIASFAPASEFGDGIGVSGEHQTSSNVITCFTSRIGKGNMMHGFDTMS